MDDKTRIEFEKQVVDLYRELKGRAWEYESNATGGETNPNADFFKGKAAAYGYSAKKLQNIFRWLSIKYPE